MTNKKFSITPDQIESELQKIINNSPKHGTSVLKQIFNCIDLTSLHTHDQISGIEALVSKVNRFSDHFNMPNVAAICVYPAMVGAVKNSLKTDDINIAAVSAGFPSSQTFLSIKLAESEICLNKGADELDIVLSVGKFLSGDLEFCSNEISIVKQSIDPAHLKVILETGLLPDAESIYNASTLALHSGADFIKTSTGKEKVSATPEAVYVMCRALKDFYEETGEMRGLKPAGGISDSDTAYQYYSIVKEVLGDKWLNNTYFRLGASSLANSILSDITETGVSYF